MIASAEPRLGTRADGAIHVVVTDRNTDLGLLVLRSVSPTGELSDPVVLASDVEVRPWLTPTLAWDIRFLLAWTRPVTLHGRPLLSKAGSLTS